MVYEQARYSIGAGREYTKPTPTPSRQAATPAPAAQSPPQTNTTTASRYGLSNRQGYVTNTYSSGGRQADKAQARALETQRLQDEAKNRQIQKTLKRQRIKSKKLMKRARVQVKKTGKAERKRLKVAGTRMEARGKQSLISRGLGNTTIQDSFARGVEEDTQRNIGLQRSGQAGQLAGLFAGEAGMQQGQAQLGLQGINMQSGGLQDYIKLMMMMNGGLS